MKNLKIIALFVLALALVALVAYWAKDKAPWNTYQNVRYAFSVNYPKDWTLGAEPTNNDGREFFSPDNTLSCRAYGFHNALINEAGEPQTLDEFIDWMEENFEYDNILGRNRTKMAGQPATEIIMTSEGTVSQAVFILGKELGYGLACFYPSVEAKDAFQQTFNGMRTSFTLAYFAKTSSASDMICEDLLLGGITPFKDVQTFSDTEYTEVTVTSRNAWDRNLLPTQVTNLESEGYTCYPMPGAFGDATPGAQPEVTRVDWSCELEYDDWTYADTDADKQAAEQAGYTCVSESCTTAGNEPSSVWRCVK